MDDQDIKHLFAQSKNMELSPQEQAQVKSNVIKYMEANPSGQRPWAFFVSPRQALAKWGFRPAMVGLASLLLVVFCGAGVSVASNNALPGDLFYPVKTQFAEKLVRLSIASESAKADYDVALVQKRLQEAEKVLVQRRLDAAASAKVQALVNTHIHDAKRNMKGEGKGRKVIDANVKLQTSLDAHAKVLDDLSEKNGQQNDEAIKSLILDVKAQAAKLRIQALEQIEADGLIEF